jgi:hypothetical protein
MAELSGKPWKRKKYGWAVLGILVPLSIGLLSWERTWGQAPQPLPAPETAIRQADQLSPTELPEKLAALEIDQATRDRLRFDPAWQPMVKAVQQDIMILKWGDSRLEHPVWQQYGAKAYPLLDYYARSADPTRQAYGMLGIRSLGKPYTTLWLERQLQRRATGSGRLYGSNFYLVTASPADLLTPYTAGSDDPYNWKQEFGLDDPATRDRFVQLARQNLEPQTSPTYYEQFNLDFLTEVLGYDAVYPSQSSLDDPKPAPAIPEWERLEKLSQPSPAQIQQAVAYYRSLPPETQEYILVNRLGQVKAGELSAFDKKFLQALAAEAQSPDRIWAIAELDRHSDPEGSELLQAILNGDLEQLYPLTRLVSYGDTFGPKISKATHAYYLLVGMAAKYPQSRFIRAAKEYGNLTGRSYFGGEPRSQAILDQIAQRTPAQRTASWQSWLDRYPDHPGGDDATYFIARGWQDQNQIMAALDLWVQLMTQRVGDGDAKYLAWAHLRSLLDVGLSSEQMEKLPQLYRSTAIAPLFRYALAVRYARAQNYAQALQASEGLDLTTMPETVLSSYYNSRFSYSLPAEANQAAVVQQKMQAMLSEQRQRWQRLRQLQTANTPEARYQIASDWAGEGGWKNGYLALWDNSRTFYLPTGEWSNEYCNRFWVCDASRGAEAVRSSYQQASQNAIALSLYKPLVDDPNTPAPLREKALYMSASTLLWQWEDHPIGETYRIHPLAGVNSSLSTPDPAATENSDAAYDAWQARLQQIEQDYLSYLDQTIATLRQQFPQSQYTDDLLFSRYAMSGQPQYLQQIVEKYPTGDRAAEAQFLLAHRRASGQTPGG